MNPSSVCFNHCPELGKGGQGAVVQSTYPPDPGMAESVGLTLWRTPAFHLPLQGSSPQRFLRHEVIFPPDESTGSSETNGKCPLARWPGHPQLLLPNRLLASPGGAAVAGVISWEDPAPSARLLPSDPVLSLTPQDLLAQQLHRMALVPRSSLPDVDISASWPWRLSLRKRVRASNLKWGRVNYRYWASVIKAFDKMVGGESWSSDNVMCECAKFMRESVCVWTCWCMHVCMCWCGYVGVYV